MKAATYKKTLFVLTLGGVLFSGYLSGEKFFRGACAFNESCPYFLGYPACYYGFVIFLVMFLLAALALNGRMETPRVKNWILGFSILGILFAGQFVIPEIKIMLAGTPTGYTLGLSTCVYGLVFYIIIFILSLFHLHGPSPEMQTTNTA